MLITVADLSTRVRQRPDAIDPDDPFATQVIQQASDIVRRAARHPEWQLPDEPPPATAKWITLSLATRVYTNPKNLTRRGIGPISESFEGLELTELERADLVDLWPAEESKGNGFWIQPTNTGRRAEPILLPDDDAPDSTMIEYAAPEDEGAFG